MYRSVDANAEHVVQADSILRYREGDFNELACYAPMRCNVDYVNWKPNMLWFDNHRILHVDEREYRLKLEVEKCHIRTWVNGEKFNDAVYRLPE